MSKTIKTRVAQKHDIEANWLKAVNFVPLAGELIIYDAETSAEDRPRDDRENLLRLEVIDYVRLKVGDGEHVVSDLPFVSDDGLVKMDPSSTLYAGEYVFEVSRPEDIFTSECGYYILDRDGNRPSVGGPDILFDLGGEDYLKVTREIPDCLYGLEYVGPVGFSINIYKSCDQLLNDVSNNKVDKIHQTGFRRVYAVNTEGQQSTLIVAAEGTDVQAKRIPYYRELGNPTVEVTGADGSTYTKNWCPNTPTVTIPVATPRVKGIDGATVDDWKYDAANKHYVDNVFYRTAQLTKDASGNATPGLIYTNSNGGAKTLKVSQSASGSDIVQRKDGHVVVPQTPAETTHATSKHYVDNIYYRTAQSTKDASGNATPGLIYTNVNGGAKTLKVSQTATDADATAIVQRTNKQIKVPEAPSASNDAASKKYVDELGARALDATQAAEMQASADKKTFTTKNGLLKVKTDDTVDVLAGYGYVHVDSAGTPNVIKQENGKAALVALDGGNNGTTKEFNSTVGASLIVQRDGTGQILVPETPSANNIATSKKYVDDGLANKLNKPTAPASTSVVVVDASNNTGTRIFDDGVTSGAIVQRTGEQIKVPLTPSATNDAASKDYVDKCVKSNAIKDRKTVYGTNTAGNNVNYLIAANKNSLLTERLPIYMSVGNNTVNTEGQSLTIPVGNPTGLYDAANKNYVDTKVGDKVDKVSTSSIVYGTDSKGVQTTIGYDSEVANNKIVQRTDVGGIKVNDIPLESSYAVNQKYVDDALRGKLDVIINAPDSFVYGQDMEEGSEITGPISFSSSVQDGSLVKRSGTQVKVPGTPVAIDDATSKEYVDAQIEDLRSSTVEEILPNEYGVFPVHESGVYFIRVEWDNEFDNAITLFETSENADPIKQPLSPCFTKTEIHAKTFEGLVQLTKPENPEFYGIRNMEPYKQMFVVSANNSGLLKLLGNKLTKPVVPSANSVVVINQGGGTETRFFGVGTESNQVSAQGGHLVQRGGGGAIIVPETPYTNNEATSKRYVDTRFVRRVTELTEMDYGSILGEKTIVTQCEYNAPQASPTVDKTTFLQTPTTLYNVDAWEGTFYGETDPEGGSGYTIPSAGFYSVNIPVEPITPNAFGNYTACGEVWLMKDDGTIEKIPYGEELSVGGAASGIEVPLGWLNKDNYETIGIKVIAQGTNYSPQEQVALKTWTTTQEHKDHYKPIITRHSEAPYDLTISNATLYAELEYSVFEPSSPNSQIYNKQVKHSGYVTLDITPLINHYLLEQNDGKMYTFACAAPIAFLSEADMPIHHATFKLSLSKSGDEYRCHALKWLRIDNESKAPNASSSSKVPAGSFTTVYCYTTQLPRWTEI